MQSAHSSEAARLRAQIQREHQLKEQAKQNPALFPEWFLVRRRKRIATCYGELAALVGKPASQQLLYEVFSSH